MQRTASQRTPGASLWRRCVKQKWLFLMVMPGLLTVLIFHYFPLYGILIAFKNYKPAYGIWNSDWAGLRYFTQFFKSPFAWRIVRNTLVLSLYNFVFGFPAPIVLALLLNEVRSARYKKLVQTVSYLPHFISVVIMVGLIKNVLSLDGAVNRLIGALGGTRIAFLSKAGWFRAIYVISGIWQDVGWGTIIYLAALSGILPDLYEAATIDGANRWQQMWNVTLPSILPTIVVLMILNVQGILNSDTQKILLLYNENVYETADVIGTYVYREGITGARYAYSAAVGLMTSLVSLVLVYLANQFTKAATEYSLW